MTFLEALEVSQRTGVKVFREGWSKSPYDDNFHHPIVVGSNGIIWTSYGNRMEWPCLTLHDYNSNDWIIVEESR